MRYARAAGSAVDMYRALQLPTPAVGEGRGRPTRVNAKWTPDGPLEGAWRTAEGLSAGAGFGCC